MQPTINVLICLLFLGVARADVAEIENQFRAAYQSHVGKQFQDEMVALDAKYLGALERAMQAATQIGKLEEALAFQDEIQRLEEKAPLPEKIDGVVPALLKLRGTYRAQLNKLLDVRKKAIAPIVEEFAAALVAYQEDLTKAGKLPEAVAVKTYRESELSQRLTGDALAVSLTADKAASDKPFENSLGMRFVPVPIIGGPTAGRTVRFSIWETRVQDYAEFVKETKQDWPKPGFAQKENHPAVNMSWDDATAFCEWLTKEERRKRKIGANDIYRLPTDHEWSCAVGIGKDQDANATPISKVNKLEAYPWGAGFPPPKGTGNFYGEETGRNAVGGKVAIQNHDDGYDRTAPAGSFAATAFGLHDLEGNVRELCKDQFDPARPELRVVRGKSWYDDKTSDFWSSNRYGTDPSNRGSHIGFRVVLEGAPAS